MNRTIRPVLVAVALLAIASSCTQSAPSGDAPIKVAAAADLVYAFEEVGPALLPSQRGGIVAEFVDPGDPFPRFHGDGGRLGRSPEPEPRVSGVITIDVHRAP